MDAELFEDYNLFAGEPDVIQGRIGALCWFLSEHGGAKKAERIMENIGDADFEDELTDTLRLLIDNVLENSEDSDEDDGAWLEVYTGLFDSSPLEQESHYIPQAGEMAKITRMCMKEQKRIRTDIDEGAIA